MATVPSVAGRHRDPGPIRPVAEGPTDSVPAEGVHSKDASIEDDPAAGDDEIEKTEELEHRVELMEKQLEREDKEPDAAVIARPDKPTKEQVERHNASGHAQFKNWCKHCVRGLATRDRHINKKNKRTKFQAKKQG